MSTRIRLKIQMAALVIVLLLLGGCATSIQSGALPNAQAKPNSADNSSSTLTPNPHSVTPTPTEVKMLNSKNAVKVDKSRFRKAAAIYSNTWINSQPLTLDDLRGKVVVVDFWTFACYNCQNTLPYFKAWDQKYSGQGLVIIGVHTPELSIERDVANVKQAVIDYGIRYPIAVDGDYANWNRYEVRAWPTWFIVDKEGYIRYSHIGEGDYAGSEATIEQLLAE